MIFGKNYDWMTGTGSVNTNLRGLQKSSLPLEGGNLLHWTSRFGSTTFNQYGKEFPNGGMNEKGLVVELMWLTESTFAAKDERPALSVLQWIQYQLDNCSTVDEVIATDKKVRIASTGTPQHYLVADARGNVATVEFLGGKMVIHRGGNLPYPVLANSTYEASVSALKSIKTKDNSLNRFANACSMLQQYKQADTNKQPVDYAFTMLQKVAQRSFTKWSIVYDITNKKIFFKSNNYQNQKVVSLSFFDYACSSKPQSFNINQDGRGEISKDFVAFNNDDNKKMVRAAFNESLGLHIDERLQKAVAEFPATLRCQ